jgi:effector-binding domain-containing protein
MKRKIVPVLLLAISAVVLFYLLFVQHEFKKTLVLKLPILTVTEQFNTPKNLQKWFVPFVNAATSSSDSVTLNNKSVNDGTYRLDVANTSIYSAILTFSTGKKNKEFLFSAMPDSAKGGFTLLNMIYKNSYLKEWLFKGDLEKKALSSFTDFKEYLDDTKRIYGYEINPVKVADTLFLFKRETVSLSDKRNATKSIFENLIAYAAKNNLGYNGNRIFYSVKGDDNVTLFASIGITREITIPENEEFEVKRMPFDKNLLEATYQGPYGEVSKVFEALKKYLSDRNLSSIAIPYQKFISDGYDFTDDQVVQMKIYYPIF